MKLSRLGAVSVGLLVGSTLAGGLLGGRALAGGGRLSEQMRLYTAMMDVVQMVLSGKTNKDIVRRINTHGGGAVGISGIDADLLRVRRLRPDGVDLGFVGEVVSVNTDFLHLLADHGSMPVVAPVGVDENGIVHNVNADTAAAAVAAFLRAEKLVYLSDVPGVLADGSLVHSLTRASAASGVVICACAICCRDCAEGIFWSSALACWKPPTTSVGLIFSIFISFRMRAARSLGAG